MTLPPLYALRAFEAAARLGSFSKAAVSLNLTPGAISKHILTLEAWFDCELFIRNGPKVEITSAGRQLAGQLHEGFQCIETACSTLHSNSSELRLKAPSTVTMRWLLNVLHSFRESYSTPVIDMVSVWMDTDTVDFNKEPYDCAILLGNGDFGAGNESRLLFEEWLIPVCAPEQVQRARDELYYCDLIHPTHDRRDWKRWTDKSGKYAGLDITSGKVFDTLEHGNIAAISGHGVSVGDLLLSYSSIADGTLALPFDEAVATGDGYYLVWPSGASRQQNVERLFAYLKNQVPDKYPDHVMFVR
jgi:DNA-binding transcriptional LysR family regulator